MKRQRSTQTKGEIGERIVAEYLQAKHNWTPYAPAVTDRPHLIDFLLVRKTDGARLWIDAKAYAATDVDGFRVTGVNQRHYDAYCNIVRAQGDRVWIYFLDHRYGKAYGQELSKLMEYRVERSPTGTIRHFPWLMQTKRNGTKIVWPLSRVQELFDLTPEQCAELHAVTKEPLNDQRVLFAA